VSDRPVLERYDDPLSLIWLDAAARLGIRVERSASAYAAWDGESTLTVASAEHLDADDSLAQLVFHELCHALVAGPDGRRRTDWGLDNTSERDLVFEHACHRVQAALAAPYGLRAFFAVTTEWRPYWDALPADPLSGTDDPAIALARRALVEAEKTAFGAVLRDALDATARMADAVRARAPDGSLWKLTRARHSSGFLAHQEPDRRCGNCAWSHGNARALACRQATRAGRTEVRVRPDTAACELWEPLLDASACAPCGACCREGFDRVELVRRDALARKHPELVTTDAWGVFIARPGGRCAALEGDGATAAFRCRVYDDRPKACADFVVGGSACLVARRRAGVSR